MVCIVPAGGPRNAGSSAILERLNIREHASQYIVASSSVTTVLLHVLGYDDIAEYIWKYVVPKRKYWSYANLLSGRPVSDTAGLICEIFHYIPVEGIDELRSEIYVAVYNVYSGETEYFRITSENAERLALASCYLPFLSHFPTRKRNVALNDHRYIDGATKDIIPMNAIGVTSQNVHRSTSKNILFVANYPYYWLPDPVPFPLRVLACMTQPNGRRLRKHLRERPELFAAHRKKLDVYQKLGNINFHAVGPKYIKDKYPIEYATDRGGICRTMQHARDLADRDRAAFEQWIESLSKQPPVP